MKYEPWLLKISHEGAIFRVRMVPTSSAKKPKSYETYLVSSADKKAFVATWVKGRWFTWGRDQPRVFYRSSSPTEKCLWSRP